SLSYANHIHVEVEGLDFFIIGFVKHGAKKWKLVDRNNFKYDDVIVFKGQFYVTDKCGTISRFDVAVADAVTAAAVTNAVIAVAATRNAAVAA
ncbi:F-box family protein, partial [Trifolium medium]|nr:F-box family protein [Trifolium medium]